MNGESSRDEAAMRERLNLIDREVATLTEKLEEIAARVEETEELKTEIRGLKIFLGREFPDFKTEFPEIIKKIVKES